MEAPVVKRGLFHIFAKGLTGLISLRTYWCVSIGACFMQQEKVVYFSRKPHEKCSKSMEIRFFRKINYIIFGIFIKKPYLWSVIN